MAEALRRQSDDPRPTAPDTGRGPAAVRLAVSHRFTVMLLNGRPPAPAERAEFVDTVLLPMLGG